MNAKTSKVNDIDAIELASGVSYVKGLNTKDESLVNGNRYKVIKKYSQSSLDYFVFERYEGDTATGEIVFAYKGTEPEDIMGDDITDLMLAGKKSPNQLEHARKEYMNLKTKLNDANNKSEREFYRLYGEETKDFKNKKIKVVTGNSLGGAHAQYVGLIDPNVQVVTTNTAPLPMSIVKNSRSSVKNIRNYHSEFDVLTQVNKGGLMYNTIKGKHIYLSNGLPTFKSLVESHTGYKVKVKAKSIINKKGEGPEVIHEISLKPTPIYTSKHGLKIYADMDEHTPIFVWSGDALGAGAPKIKLDKSNLSELESYVNGRLTNYVEQISAKMKDVQQSVDEDHDKFHEYVDRSKDVFNKITHYKEIESIIDYCTGSLKGIISQSVNSLSADLNNLKYDKHISHLPGAEWIIDEISNTLHNIEDKFKEFINKGEELISGLRDIRNNHVQKIFISPTFGFIDGVREEMLAHFAIVIPNIEIVNKQVGNYGNGISDILTKMSNIDDNVMVNQVSINHSATKQTQETIQDSQYMQDKLAVIENNLDFGIKVFSKVVSYLVVPITWAISKQIDGFRYIDSKLTTAVEKLEWIAKKNPTCITCSCRTF
ncbi:hypothetical protein [Mammaliicoccus sp. Dog046]|uniref:hypothetical protein n=1 Tax=Mammaliicoccus sp. Dog046 TaxID=3034233 RepID=UPI002B260FA2|nr:hypothetical protein [Mammaliicoccus sp. Dog046]WQK86344.1 hypothetical protein P3U32_04860 [Mammaliicoccus sp. Dog046]